MKALYTQRPGDYGLRERPKPTPTEGEVLVRVQSVAICHTDLNIRHGLSSAMRYPRIPGHEIAGMVEAVGSGVTAIAPGDFGALQTIIGCGGCPPCRLGFVNNCEQFDELGLRRDGGFAEYATIPWRNFVKMPASISPDEACLTEPLANAVSAVRRVRPHPTRTAVVIGPGPIGLLAVAVLRLHGVRGIALAGTRDERLELGRAFGAEHLVNVQRCDAADMIKNRLFGGKGADIVLDCSGTVSGFRLAMDTVARFGLIGIEGLVRTDDAIPFSPGMMPGNSEILNIEGWLPSDFETAAQLITHGQIGVGPLITHRMPLAQWERAFSLVEAKQDGVIKVILHPGEEGGGGQ